MAPRSVSGSTAPMMLLTLAADSTLQVPDNSASRLSNGSAADDPAITPRAARAAAPVTPNSRFQVRGVRAKSNIGPPSTFQVQGRRLRPTSPAIAATLTPL